MFVRLLIATVGGMIPRGVRGRTHETTCCCFGSPASLSRVLVLQLACQGFAPALLSVRVFAGLPRLDTAIGPSDDPNADNGGQFEPIKMLFIVRKPAKQKKNREKTYRRRLSTYGPDSFQRNKTIDGIVMTSTPHPESPFYPITG